jgi:hypothetical protein
MKTMMKALVLSLLMLSSFAEVVCSNSAGYRVVVSDAKTAELTTPYVNIYIQDLSGTNTYFYSNVASSSIRSFSLSVNGSSSSLIVIRKNARPSMDRQNLNCQGAVR